MRLLSLGDGRHPREVRQDALDTLLLRPLDCCVGKIAARIFGSGSSGHCSYDIAMDAHFPVNCVFLRIPDVGGRYRAAAWEGQEKLP